MLIGDEKPFRWAKRIGLSKGTLTSILRLGNHPQAKTLDKIAAETGCSRAWLEEGKGKPFPAGDHAALQNAPAVSDDEYLNYEHSAASVLDEKAGRDPVVGRVVYDAAKGHSGPRSGLRCEDAFMPAYTDGDTKRDQFLTWLTLKLLEIEGFRILPEEKKLNIPERLARILVATGGAESSYSLFMQFPELVDEVFALLQIYEKLYQEYVRR
jgi:transcriptional regulator with XRE-family HTH domain